MKDFMDHINLYKDGDIGILELNKPPENYLTQPEFIPIEVLKEFVETGLKGLVISGVGRHFSAGADPRKIIQDTSKQEQLKSELIRGNLLLNYIENLKIPVVSAINGVCFGGGLEIALACHIRIASHRSLFAFPEINQGIVPGLGGIPKTKKIAGAMSTLRLILSGDTINAKTARELQLVDELSEQKNIQEVALQLLKEITAGRSLKIINAVMLSIHNSRNLVYENALKKDAEMFCELALDEVKQRK